MHSASVEPVNNFCKQTFRLGNTWKDSSHLLFYILKEIKNKQMKQNLDNTKIEMNNK